MTKPFWINREQFKTELGRQCYDKIMELNPPNNDALYLILYLIKGDERKKIFMKFLASGQKSWRETFDFVFEKWGDEGERIL